MNASICRPSIDLAPTDGTSDLESRVRSRLGRQVREFRLVIADTGLVLRGRAQTYYAKQLAQHLVMDATKLPILANEIEVC